MRHAGARTPAQVGDEDIGSPTLSNTDLGSFGELEVHTRWINRGTMVIHDTVLVCQAERNALGQDDGVALACDEQIYQQPQCCEQKDGQKNSVCPQNEVVNPYCEVKYFGMLILIIE